MRTRLEVGFDPSYLRQLLDYLVYIIGSLEAPARRESTKQVAAIAQAMLLLICQLTQ